MTSAAPFLPDEFEDIDDVIAEAERDPKRAAYLQQARQRLVELEPDRIKGLAALRLRRGWSQARLASEIGTCPSNIARLESGREEIEMKTARRLGLALGVPPEAISSSRAVVR